MTKFTNIPNNNDGKTFIKVLRQSVKNTPFRLSIRGRGPRKLWSIDGYSYTRLRQDLPLDMSTHFSVYLVRKPLVRYVKTTKTVTEWVKVPTKWGKLKGILV